jgi:hypothetical protein
MTLAFVLLPTIDTLRLLRSNTLLHVRVVEVAELAALAIGMVG